MILRVYIYIYILLCKYRWTFPLLYQSHTNLQNFRPLEVQSVCGSGKDSVGTVAHMASLVAGDGDAFVREFGSWGWYLGGYKSSHNHGSQKLVYLQYYSHFILGVIWKWVYNKPSPILYENKVWMAIMYSYLFKHSHFPLNHDYGGKTKFESWGPPMATWVVFLLKRHISTTATTNSRHPNTSWGSVFFWYILGVQS